MLPQCPFITFSRNEFGGFSDCGYHYSVLGLSEASASSGRGMWDNETRTTQLLSLIGGYSNIIVNANSEVEMPLIPQGLPKEHLKNLPGIQFRERKKSASHRWPLPPWTLRPISGLATLSMASQMDVLRSIYPSFAWRLPKKPSHGLANERRLCLLSDSITTAFDTSRFPFFHVEALSLLYSPNHWGCLLTFSFEMLTYMFSNFGGAEHDIRETDSCKLQEIFLLVSADSH